MIWSCTSCAETVRGPLELIVIPNCVTCSCYIVSICCTYVRHILPDGSPYAVAFPQVYHGPKEAHRHLQIHPLLHHASCSAIGLRRPVGVPLVVPAFE